MKKILFISTILILMFFSLSFADERGGHSSSFSKPSLEGVLDTMAINNIFLPYQNDGSTADDANAFFPNGTNLSFLFQGGIAASGFIGGQLRASWMAKASLIQEFQAGNWGVSPGDPKAKFYVVTASDGPGSEAYVNWADAVASGADFQDVDGDGTYNPNVDRPDLLGDRTSWCVYNDGTGEDIRSNGLQTQPMGLEVHQTVWAFARADDLGNVIFLRYRFINVGGEDINDFIFSIWADPDVGEATDDLIGSDTTLSLGYIYNDGDDPNYGAAPPAFGVDFFQGPLIDSPGDTAYLFRGPWFGVDTLVDKKNLPMTSFIFYNNAGETDPFPSPQQNVERARDYQVGGFNGHREPIDPTVFGVGGTANDNPKYFYTGEPEAGTGWRDTEAKDKRFMVNTGPFQLAAWQDQNGNGRPDPNEPGVQDIVVAYVVGQGNGPTNSVTVLKQVDQTAQLAYNANFFVAGPPPPPEVKVRTFDQKIEFIIDLDADSTFDYDQTDKLLNRQIFEGIKIYQFNSPSTNEIENGFPNRKLIATFDLDNEYKDIFQTQGNETFQIFKGKNNLNGEVIEDDGAAVLRYVVETDAFATTPPGLLVNNIEYYFSITSFSINPPFMTDLGGGSWVGGSGILLENSLGGPQFHTVVPGSDENQPFKSDSAMYIGTRRNHDGKVYVDVVDRDSLTGDNYSIRFFDNGNYWRILNESKGGELVRDSLVFQDTLGGSEWTFPIFDGFSAKVLDAKDQLSTVELSYDTAKTIWLRGNASANFKPSALFDQGINLMKLEKPSLSTIKKHEYFPVRVEIDTSLQVSGYLYIGAFALARGTFPIPVRAFDITDPQNERQLNIAYSGLPTGVLNFVNNNIVIMKSDYDPQNAYPSSGPPDSSFKADAYIIMNLQVVADTLEKTKLEFTITPYYPNSDLDVYSISTENLQPILSNTEIKDNLKKINVVPNPYWGYSIYETSYDTPVLKFTHLPREVTIRIFDLAGNLIKTLTKNDESNEIQWNLRNEASLRIASGMYIAHVDAPGIGSKILKFAVVQREERLDRY